jgi:archaellin
LSAFNNDFATNASEFYDVFYSDADGSFNVNGKFVTIEAVFNRGAPAGGGLTLAEVQFNFSAGSTDLADSVASFVALGDNALPSTAGNAVDGNLLTATTMGNTIGQMQRLRVTVKSSRGADG